MRLPVPPPFSEDGETKAQGLGRAAPDHLEGQCETQVLSASYHPEEQSFVWEPLSPPSLGSMLPSWTLLEGGGDRPVSGTLGSTDTGLGSHLIKGQGLPVCFFLPGLLPVSGTCACLSPPPSQPCEGTSPYTMLSKRNGYHSKPGQESKAIQSFDPTRKKL